MNCIHPGAVSADELVAYADGEAPKHIIEHLQACPACAAAAGEYDRAQRRLGGGLYRFDCPPPHRLGEYELHVLSPIEQTQVAAHVVDCPRCAEELQTLRTFLVTELAPTPVGPGERVRRIVATLLQPTPGAAYAGLRGAGDTATQTYRAGDITITIGPGSELRRGRGSLAGLIWREGAAVETLVGSVVALIAPDGTAETTEVDDLGNFAFDEVTPGTYRLEVTLGDQLVTIDGLRIGR